MSDHNEYTLVGSFARFVKLICVVFLLLVPHTLLQATPQRAVSPSKDEPPSNPATPPSHTDPITDDPDSPYILPDNPAGVPIDGGAFLLLLSGAAAGATVLRRRKQEEMRRRRQQT